MWITATTSTNTKLNEIKERNKRKQSNGKCDFELYSVWSLSLIRSIFWSGIYIEWNRAVEMEWKQIVSANFQFFNFEKLLIVLQLLWKRLSWPKDEIKKWKKANNGLKQLKLDHKRNLLPNDSAKRNRTLFSFRILASDQTEANQMMKIIID